MNWGLFSLSQVVSMFFFLLRTISLLLLLLFLFKLVISKKIKTNNNKVDKQKLNISSWLLFITICFFCCCYCERLYTTACLSLSFRSFRILKSFGLFRFVSVSIFFFSLLTFLFTFFQFSFVFYYFIISVVVVSFSFLLIWARHGKKSASPPLSSTNRKKKLSYSFP